MKRIHRSAPALLFVFLLLASLVAPPGLAKAASTYDNSYQSTETVRSWWNHQNCDSVDLTLDWKSYLLDESKWPAGSDYSATRTSLQSALNNETDGAWGVTQFISEISNVVQIYWTEDPTASLNWAGSGVDAVTTSGGNNIHVIDLACSQKFYGSRGPTPAIISVADAPSHKISTSPTWTMFYKMRNLFVHGFDLNYPSGYEGPQVLTEQPKAKYVAMGDSFSSGEGNPKFEPGTDTKSNACHRSSKAYPRLLQNDPSLNLGPMAFVACGGATTDSIMKGQWNEPAQIDALSEATEVVTITIGGNNIGFADFATACSLDICNFSTPVYSSVVDKINNTLPSELNATFEAIAARVPTTAKIRVVGYPYITPAVMPSGFGSGTCWPFNGQADNPDPALNDGATAHDVVARLNSALSHAVSGANDPRFSFVDPNGTESPFIDHDWCKQDRYFQIVALGNLEYSFHPNQDGHNAYKTIVKHAIA